MTLNNRILFLNSTAAGSVFIHHCLVNQIPFVSIIADVKVPNVRKLITHSKSYKSIYEKVSEQSSYTIEYEKFYNLDFLIKFLDQLGFEPNFIVSPSELPENLNIEEKLNAFYACNTYFDKTAKKFFLAKSYQNQLCKEIGIKVLPSYGDLLCVKRDCKNRGLSDDIPKFRCEPSTYKAKEGEFVQKWAKKEATYGVRTYIDDIGNFYVLSTVKCLYEKELPVTILDPYKFAKNENELILDYIRKLCGKIYVRNRLVYWEFIKEKGDENIYHQDFNCRPGGDLHHHRRDITVLETDFPTILFGGAEKITQTFRVFKQGIVHCVAKRLVERVSAEKVRKLIWYEDPMIIENPNDHITQSSPETTLLRHDGLVR